MGAVHFGVGEAQAKPQPPGQGSGQLLQTSTLLPAHGGGVQRPPGIVAVAVGVGVGVSGQPCNALSTQPMRVLI